MLKEHAKYNYEPDRSFLPRGLCNLNATQTHKNKREFSPRVFFANKCHRILPRFQCICGRNHENLGGLMVLAWNLFAQEFNHMPARLGTISSKEHNKT
jgi:hypothetical protein